MAKFRDNSKSNKVPNCKVRQFHSRSQLIDRNHCHKIIVFLEKLEDWSVDVATRRRRETMVKFCHLKEHISQKILKTYQQSNTKDMLSMKFLSNLSLIWHRDSKLLMSNTAITQATQRRNSKMSSSTYDNHLTSAPNNRCKADSMARMTKKMKPITCIAIDMLTIQKKV